MLVIIVPSAAIPVIVSVMSSSDLLKAGVFVT